MFCCVYFCYELGYFFFVLFYFLFLYFMKEKEGEAGLVGRRGDEDDLGGLGQKE